MLSKFAENLSILTLHPYPPSVARAKPTVTPPPTRTQAVLSRVHLTLRATRTQPHSAPSWHYRDGHRRDAQVYAHTPTAMNDTGTPPPAPPLQ